MIHFLVLFAFIIPVNAFFLVSHRGASQLKDNTTGWSKCNIPVESDADYLIENSFEAVAFASKNAADVIEIDLQFTNDGEVILLHDHNPLYRVGLPQPIHNYTLKEISSIDLMDCIKFKKIKKPNSITKKVFLTRFESLLEKFPQQAFLINPKLFKTGDGFRLAKILKKYERSVDYSKYHYWGYEEFYKEIKQLIPNFGNYYLPANRVNTCIFFWNLFHDFPLQCKNEVLFINTNRIFDYSLFSFIEEAKKNGSPVYLISTGSLFEMNYLQSVGFGGVLVDGVSVWKSLKIKKALGEF